MMSFNFMLWYKEIITAPPDCTVSGKIPRKHVIFWQNLVDLDVACYSTHENNCGPYILWSWTGLFLNKLGGTTYSSLMSLMLPILEKRICLSLRFTTHRSVMSAENSGDVRKTDMRTFRDFRYEASDVIISNIAWKLCINSPV